MAMTASRNEPRRRSPIRGSHVGATDGDARVASHPRRRTIKALVATMAKVHPHALFVERCRFRRCIYPRCLDHRATTLAHKGRAACASGGITVGTEAIGIARQCARGAMWWLL
ncbi:hypothetical protein MRX96_046226 [Rhipicephalus microplus]